MSFLSATRSVERQRFFDGQRLFASDLQGIEAFNREMRWLHNQSLHQPGIGNGFAVTGNKGDREVTAAPGYAIDDLGREIVLTSSRTIPVPPVAGDLDGKPKRFVLTIQYPESADLEEVERREGICDTSGAVRLREEPIFCWVPLNPDGSPERDQGEIMIGRKLVLGEIAVRDCKLDKAISIVQRRNARPPSQPYIACGSEEPTAWETWDLFDEGDDDSPTFATFASQLNNLYQIVGGIQARIDTSRGGFLTVPGYFGRIDGPRVIEVANGEETIKVVLDGILNIFEPTATGFTAQVVVLLFTADRPRIPAIVRRAARETGSGGAHFVEGFDLSALTFAISQPTFAAAPETESEREELAAAAADEPNLPDLLRDWTVGWMGVEG
ncbi:MAG: hypothetical protein M3354_02135 [Chloroflexota bacterium]|nr:hypothetical protein [Chloroflexota bacterium]